MSTAFGALGLWGALGFLGALGFFTAKDFTLCLSNAFRFSAYFRRRSRRRTPGPPPFSSMNSTPADSSARRIFLPVSFRPPNGPSWASRRFIVGTDTFATAASRSWDQASSARAAFSCLIDTFGIDLLGML